MTVVHIVLFKLNKDLSEEKVRKLCDDFLTLDSKCLHPTTGKPYMLSISGGKDKSPEGQQHGHTHGFVEEFANLADRDYYLNEDPGHKEFVKNHAAEIDSHCVIDYEKGVY